MSNKVPYTNLQCQSRTSPTQKITKIITMLTINSRSPNISTYCCILVSIIKEKIQHSQTLDGTTLFHMEKKQSKDSFYSRHWFPMATGLSQWLMKGNLLT